MQYLAWGGAAGLFLAAAAGCSALIDPDEDRLGGDVDGGPRDGGGGDGGGGDAGPGCPAGCDDGVMCTDDRCNEADRRCEHNPMDGRCGADMRCNPVMGCVPLRCSEDGECDDGLFCTGEESCDPAAGGADPRTGCVAGTAVTCADETGCTTDACDEDADRCTFVGDNLFCADTIACTVDVCDPEESDEPSGCVRTADDALCDDGFCMTGGFCDPSTGCVGGSPRECGDDDPCTADSCDAAASACVHPIRDEDGDTFSAGVIFVDGGRVDCGGPDCNDADPTVFPGAEEHCNGRDDNCDGMIDEGCPAPDGEDCGSAVPIPLERGMGRALGSLGSFGDDYTTRCGAEGGPDAVYYIEVTGVVDVTIDTIGSGTDTVLAVSADCSEDGLFLGCDDDLNPPGTTNSRLFVHRFGSAFPVPTRLFILVDGYNGSATGAFTLNVRVAPATADACPAGGMDISGGGTAVGEIGGPIGAFGPFGSCQLMSDRADPEAIFTVRSGSSSSSDFEAVSDDFVPDLYVRTSPCGSGMELACDRGSSSGPFNSATVTTMFAMGATYYVFVDNGTAGGGYALDYDP